MKTLLATAAFAVVVSTVSPASAQFFTDRRDTQSFRAFAQEPLTVQQRRAFVRARSLDGRIHSPSPAFDVYDNQGRYVSSDPDPFIRNELSRDPPGRGDD